MCLYRSAPFGGDGVHELEVCLRLSQENGKRESEGDIYIPCSAESESQSEKDEMKRLKVV